MIFLWWIRIHLAGGPGAGTPTPSERRIDDFQVSNRKLFRSTDASDHILLPVLSTTV